MLYEEITNSVRVRVEPSFLEEQSSPAERYYFWSYEVEIHNLGVDTVQLRTRHWRITDANGFTEEVNGAGVVGQEPVLKPGETFSYTSGAPLNTPNGMMMGAYTMQRDNGEMFEVIIPAFSLDSPYTEMVLN